MGTSFSNTGHVSFILYGLFIVITITGMAIALYHIRKGIIPTDRLEKMIELFKYAIVTTAIATTTLIVSDLFKEREQDVKELEYFDKYVQDVKKADNILERRQLSKYLSIVAPSGDLKVSWQSYYDTVEKEYAEYLQLKAQQSQTNDSGSIPQTPEELRKDAIIQAAEGPLATGFINTKLPSDHFVVNSSPDEIKASEMEREGFMALMNGNYEMAARAFTQSENAKNRFRASFELSKLLRKNATAMHTDPELRKSVLLEIRKNYAAFAPPEVKKWLEAQVR